jgi:hypothetical protein
MPPVPLHLKTAKARNLANRPTSQVLPASLILHGKVTSARRQPGMRGYASMPVPALTACRPPHHLTTWQNTQLVCQLSYNHLPPCTVSTISAMRSSYTNVAASCSTMQTPIKVVSLVWWHVCCSSELPQQINTRVSPK